MPPDDPLQAYFEGRGAEQNNPHFTSMDHEIFTGMLNGLIATHKADLLAVRAYPEKDGAGIYRPIIVVEMTSGATFRLVVAEV
jgi:hypothetical protein